MGYRTRQTSAGALDQFSVTVTRTETSSTVATYYYGSQTSKRTDDYVNGPGYHSALKCGKILPSYVFSVVSEETVLTPGPVTAQITAYSTPETYTGNACHPAGFWAHPDRMPQPSFNDSYLSAAIMDSRVAAVNNRMDILTSLAELRKTVGTLGNVVRRFNGTTADIADRAVKTARRFRKNPFGVFNDLWLEARYGIRPIIYDAQSAGDALGKILARVHPFTIGRGQTLQSVNEMSSVPYSGGDVNFEYPWTQRWEGSYSLRGWSACEFGSLIDTVFQADPLVTAYELVPYSFVVDWFVDIGGWISTLTPQLTGDLTSSASIKADLTYTSTFAAVVKSGRGSGEWNYGSVTQKVKSYNRFPAGGELPQWRPNLSLPKLVDIAALARAGDLRVQNRLAQARLDETREWRRSQRRSQRR